MRISCDSGIPSRQASIQAPWPQMDPLVTVRANPQPPSTLRLPTLQQLQLRKLSPAHGPRQVHRDPCQSPKVGNSPPLPQLTPGACPPSPCPQAGFHPLRRLVVKNGGQAGKKMVVMLAGLRGHGRGQNRLESSEVWGPGKGLLGIES